MKPKVYLETTVVSYLTAWPSRDVIMHGKQQATRDWWAKRRQEFDLCTSQLVVAEASAGDPQAVQDRLRVLQGIPLLDLIPEAEALTQKLLDMDALPEKASVDAAHIAAAAVHGIDYLITWNCRHLANATMRSQIEEVCRGVGFAPPIICTPYELLGE